MEHIKITDLIEESEYKRELEKEIENFDNFISNTRVFLWLLNAEQNKFFTELSKYKIYDLYKEILVFMNSNYQDFKKMYQSNIYFEYFVKLLDYFWKHQTTWRIINFNDTIVKGINRTKLLADYQKELLVHIKSWDILHIVEKEVASYIMELQTELLEDLIEIEDKYGLNWKTLKWVQLENLEELLLEDKLSKNKNRFSDILNTLHFDKLSSMWTVLNEKNLLEDLEYLYYFVEENKSYILKQENWKLIYDFIVWLQENLLNQTFDEFIQNFDLKYDWEVHNLPNVFSKVFKKTR